MANDDGDVTVSKLPGEGEWRFAFNFPMLDLSRKKPGVTMAQPLFPDRFSLCVGRLAIFWTQFEQALNEFLVPLCKSGGIPLENLYKLRAFKKRKELCREQAKREFGEDSEIYSYVNSLLTDAAALSVSRNLILHGDVSSFVELFANGDNPPTAILNLSTAGRHNGAVMEKKFSFTELENLMYALSELAGRAQDLREQDLTETDVNVLGLSLPSKLRLLDFLRANR